MTQRRNENHAQHENDRRKVGQRMRRIREGLPATERQIKEVAKKLNISDAKLSKIESGNVSLGLDEIDAFCSIYGCRPEAITTDNAYPDSDKLPFEDSVNFLQQTQDLGVEGIYRDRESSLDYLQAFAKEMRSGRIFITGSSLRGLEQKSEHAFVHQLREFGDNPHFEMRVIMTHPELGSERECQERRPPGSITREILTNIVWGLDYLHIKPQDLRLSKVSPSSFSIFMLDGPEGRAIINPYPTMRQAYLSYTLAVRMVQPGKGAGAAASIFQTYLEANFHSPWDNDQLTVRLKKGLSAWRKDKEAEEFEPYLKGIDKFLSS